MKLLGRTSSINVRKVLWAASEIGLAIDHDDRWGSSQSTRAPEFAALNPHCLIPVWIDDCGVLNESNTICRYLAARYDRDDLLPAKPYERAQVERWMDWCGGDLNRAWSYAFMALVRADLDYDDQTSIKLSISRWNNMMEVFNEHLAKTVPYACGGIFTLADVCLGLAVQRWLKTPLPDRPKLPNVDLYFSKLRERPIFRSLTTDNLP